MNLHTNARCRQNQDVNTDHLFFKGCKANLTTERWKSMVVSFDVMQSCAIAAAVVMVGRAIVKKVRIFQTYCIPGVIVCVLLEALHSEC